MAQCPNKPSSTEMASQCRKSLSPKELNQVLIGMYACIIVHVS